MIGVFVSLDLFLFYVFWDAMLIPMYFLIGIWGYDQRIYAAVKFMLYTMAGSVLMLVAILGLAYLHSEATGVYSFDLLKLYALTIAPRRRSGSSWRSRWPSPSRCRCSRSTPGCPTRTCRRRRRLGDPGRRAAEDGHLRPAALRLPAVPGGGASCSRRGSRCSRSIGIVYGALVAMVQPDMKKLVAYSSVSHLGFVVLGICAMNVAGRAGRRLPDAGARHQHRRALPHRRHAVRPAAHAPDRRVRRARRR